MFCLLGVSFFVVGLTMNLSLRRYFPHFYTSYSCFLWTACLFLTLPLFLRAFINFELSFSESFETWWSNEDRFYMTNTVYLVLSTYIPIIA